MNFFHSNPFPGDSLSRRKFSDASLIFPIFAPLRILTFYACLYASLYAPLIHLHASSRPFCFLLLSVKIYRLCFCDFSLLEEISIFQITQLCTIESVTDRLAFSQRSLAALRGLLNRTAHWDWSLSETVTKVRYKYSNWSSVIQCEVFERRKFGLNQKTFGSRCLWWKTFSGCWVEDVQ